MVISDTGLSPDIVETGHLIFFKSFFRVDSGHSLLFARFAAHTSPGVVTIRRILNFGSPVL